MTVSLIFAVAVVTTYDGDGSLVLTINCQGIEAAEKEARIQWLDGLDPDVWAVKIDGKLKYLKAQQQY